MPTNVTPQYQKAEQEYYEAETSEQKLKALRHMLSLAPTHKGAEKLRKEIKQKLAKIKYVQEKEKQSKKSGFSLMIKKEGAATASIVGTPNSGKSTLLKQLTNANPEIADYPFTTKKPEVGTLDYKGIKIQIIELPAITENYLDTQNGPTFMSIVRSSDLIILCYNDEAELKLLKKELKISDIDLPLISSKEENLQDKIWQKLKLVKIYTKQPGKPKSFPPIAFKKGSTIKDLAGRVHKDFTKKFKFARIYGPSAKFEGQRVGLDHKLKDEDVVELHLS